MSDRKQREFERREQEILKSALELFGNEQWEKVTVAQIAEHADIGKGTVYKHFASKEEIYARLILDDSQETMAAFERCVQEGENPVEIIRHLLEYSFHKFSDSTCMRMHFHCKQRAFRERLSPEIQQQFAEREHAFMQLVAPVLEQGMANGDFMQRPLYQAFTGLEAIFDGTLLMLRNEDYLCLAEYKTEFSTTQFIADMVAFMLSSLTGKVEKHHTPE